MRRRRMWHIAVDVRRACAVNAKLNLSPELFDGWLRDSGLELYRKTGQDVTRSHIAKVLLPFGADTANPPRAERWIAAAATDGIAAFTLRVGAASAARRARAATWTRWPHISTALELRSYE